MDKAMLRAAVLYSVSTAYGAWVGFSRNIPSEPLRLRIPGAQLNDAFARWLVTSGTSAPWPMPVLCLVAAVSAREGRQWPQRTIATVAAIHVIGTLAEPVTWGRRTRGPEVVAHVALDVVSVAALLTSIRRRQG